MKSVIVSRALASGVRVWVWIWVWGMGVGGVRVLQPQFIVLALLDGSAVQPCGGGVVVVGVFVETVCQSV